MSLNKPKFSKINWTAGGTFIAGCLVAFGIVPDEHKDLVLQALTVFPPLVIMVWRTWFTG